MREKNIFICKQRHSQHPTSINLNPTELLLLENMVGGSTLPSIKGSEGFTL